MMVHRHDQKTDVDARIAIVSVSQGVSGGVGAVVTVVMGSARTVTEIVAGVGRAGGRGGRRGMGRGRLCRRSSRLCMDLVELFRRRRLDSRREVLMGMGMGRLEVEGGEAMTGIEGMVVVGVSVGRDLVMKVVVGAWACMILRGRGGGSESRKGCSISLRWRGTYGVVLWVVSICVGVL